VNFWRYLPPGEELTPEEVAREQHARFRVPYRPEAQAGAGEAGDAL
jgi:hypothetical protein